MDLKEHERRQKAAEAKAAAFNKNGGKDPEPAAEPEPSSDEASTDEPSVDELASVQADDDDDEEGADGEDGAEDDES
jgi:hypothetical protein